jgi:hypothetical protein
VGPAAPARDQPLGRDNADLEVHYGVDLDAPRPRSGVRRPLDRWIAYWTRRRRRIIRSVLAYPPVGATRFATTPSFKQPSRPASTTPGTPHGLEALREQRQRRPDALVGLSLHLTRRATHDLIITQRNHPLRGMPHWVGTPVTAQGIRSGAIRHKTHEDF